jgi:hypothetical protein
MLRISLCSIALALLLMGAILGCGGGGGSSDPDSVTITANPSTVMQGQSVRLTWTSVGTTSVLSSNCSAAYLAGSTVVFPTQSPTTTYTITMQGADGSSHTGQVNVTVIPTAALTVTPNSVTLSVGDSQSFTAMMSGATTSAVTWAVVESGGGAITPDGVYTAPATHGTYHVTAKSEADPTNFVTVTVTVQSGDSDITLK